MAKTRKRSPKKQDSRQRTGKALTQNGVMNIFRQRGHISIIRLSKEIEAHDGKLDRKKLDKILTSLKSKQKILEVKPGEYVIKSRKKSDDPIPRKDYHMICKRYNLRKGFPQDVKAEMKTASRSHSPKQLDSFLKFSSRKDYRQNPVITIDGSDAKDLDDAVFVKKSDTGFHLEVHIADVSYYVRENSKVDIEALERGTSVYLVDKVVPMLPELLSNNLCSLNPNEEKLCFSVEIELDNNGDVTDYTICEGIIESKRRFTYNRVQKILDLVKKSPDNAEILLDPQEDENFIPMLKDAAELARILCDKRLASGSLDFDVPELKFECDENSYPIRVKKRERLFSHRIIEEFMLLANKVVAGFMLENGRGLYRIHEQPDPEKIASTESFLRRMGYMLRDRSLLDHANIQKIIDQAKERNETSLVNTILVRSMKQAIYYPVNKGHFGLNFENYTHFTSPIRRYPDLMVHRIVKNILGISKHSKNTKDEKYLEYVAWKSSTTERNAVEAERDIVKIKSARFMKQFIGRNLKGKISGIIQTGIFVELLPYGIEGMCPIKNLLGSYHFDEENLLLIRQDKNETYRIGDSMSVIVAGVNVRKGFVDLEIL